MYANAIMDMRSDTHAALKKLLERAGIYEEDMKLSEMRSMAMVVQESLRHNSIDNWWDEVDKENMNLARAIEESECDYQLKAADNIMWNSTMIAPNSEPISANSFTEPATVIVVVDTAQQGVVEGEVEPNSLPTSPVYMSVEAIVHHPLDWSPNGERRAARKRRTDSNDHDNNNVNVKSALRDNSAELQSTPISMGTSDSEISWEDPVTISSISGGSTVPSIGEMPSRLLISTSSAAVSGFSLDEHQHNSSAQ